MLFVWISYPDSYPDRYMFVYQGPIHINKQIIAIVIVNVKVGKLHPNFELPIIWMTSKIARFVDHWMNLNIVPLTSQARA